LQIGNLEVGIVAARSGVGRASTATIDIARSKIVFKVWIVD
jgi:hypothetical protein